MRLSAPGFLRAVLPVFLLLALSAPSFGWWKSEWTVRRKVTVDTSSTGAGIAEPIGGGVILLRLHDGNFQFPLAKEDGSDLRILAEDDKTLLPFHLERLDPLLNEGFVWVRIPDLKPGAKTVIYLYYGNAGNSVTSAADPKATYEAETAVVYHFSEHAGPPSDSSGKGNNAQTAPVPVAGSLIAGGARFDGKNAVTIPAGPALATGGGSPLTVSLWAKPGPAAPGQILFSRREEGKAFLLGLDNGVPFVEISGQRAAAGAPLAPAAWHHLAAVSDGAKVTLYVEGEAAATLSAALPALNSPITLGNDTAEGAAGFVGEMDEFQLAKLARPVAQLRLAVAAQGGEAASKLLTFGEDEQNASWFAGGTTAVLFNSLTADGWAVVIVLAVMGLISWYVMISKVRKLNAVSRGNALFMEQWQHLAADLTALDGGTPETAHTLGGRADPKMLKAFRNSPLYHIYHVGVEEIRHRVQGQPTALRVLSGLSMQAVRASMDGRLVRETQKLGQLIVFLTLSISGGPFIGLLGTVIGVMITFAAIAAAGDVNVNAIAPGIAAALLATVAGMAVAIPALFGYNYILSRMKDVSSDMHVFIDEFVTKAAEYYSEGRYSPRVRAATAPVETVTPPQL